MDYNWIVKSTNEVSSSAEVLGTTVTFYFKVLISEGLMAYHTEYMYIKYHNTPPHIQAAYIGLSIYLFNKYWIIIYAIHPSGLPRYTGRNWENLAVYSLILLYRHLI